MTIWSSIASWFGAAPSDPRNGRQRPISSGQSTARPVTFDSAMTVSAVFAASRLLSETVASLPLNMYELKKDGSRVKVDNHSLIRLLKYRPNRRQTRIEFFEQFMLNLVSSGNAYCLKGFLKKELVSLQVINSGSIQPELMPDGSIIYHWRKSDGTTVQKDESEIWHVRLFGTGVTGMSPLVAASKSIGIALAADDRVTDLISKNTPSGALTVPNTPNKEQRDVMRSELTQMVANDSIPVFPDGAKFEAFSLTPEDLELLATRKFAIEDIARIYGTPSVLLNDTSTSTVWGSGIGQLISGFYKFNLRPYLEKTELSMVVNLLPPESWGKFEFEFAADAILRSDKKDRVEMGTKEVNGGLISLNEYRRDEGLPPVQGGDGIRVALNMTVLDEFGKIIPLATKTEDNTT